MCLTDPHSRARWQQDPAARRAIATLWRYDPDPAATLAIQSQIDAAVTAGSAVAGTSRGQRHYYCCPWSAIYQARQPVTIAGHQLRPMQEFTFDVSAEEMADGGQFTRQLLTGPPHHQRDRLLRPRSRRLTAGGTVTYRRDALRDV